MSPRGRAVRRAAEYTIALVLGVVGYLWAGGPNVLMLLAAFALLVVALLDDTMEVTDNAK